MRTDKNIDDKKRALKKSGNMLKKHDGLERKRKNLENEVKASGYRQDKENLKKVKKAERLERKEATVARDFNDNIYDNFSKNEIEAAGGKGMLEAGFLKKLQKESIPPVMPKVKNEKQAKSDRYKYKTEKAPKPGQKPKANHVKPVAAKPAAVKTVKPKQPVVIPPKQRSQALPPPKAQQPTIIVITNQPKPREPQKQIETRKPASRPGSTKKPLAIKYKN